MKIILLFFHAYFYCMALLKIVRRHVNEKLCTYFFAGSFGGLQIDRKSLSFNMDHGYNPKLRRPLRLFTVAFFLYPAPVIGSNPTMHFLTLVYPKITHHLYMWQYKETCNFRFYPWSKKQVTWLTFCVS